jgi:nitrogen fixation protein NifU and related proteins
MSELRELYQQVILDHNKNPRNFGPLENANRTSEGRNPLCGDEIKVYLRLDGDTIEDIKFEGRGCAISKASASMMTMTLKGKTTDEAEKLFQSVHDMLTGEGNPDADIDDEEMGRLVVLSGVREFPVRVKCASLGWHAMRAALKEESKTVSTE